MTVNVDLKPLTGGAEGSASTPGGGGSGVGAFGGCGASAHGGCVPSSAAAGWVACAVGCAAAGGTAGIGGGRDTSVRSGDVFGGAAGAAASPAGLGERTGGGVSRLRGLRNTN